MLSFLQTVRADPSEHMRVCACVHNVWACVPCHGLSQFPGPGAPAGKLAPRSCSSRAEPEPNPWLMHNASKPASRFLFPAASQRAPVVVFQFRRSSNTTPTSAPSHQTHAPVRSHVKPKC